MSLIKAKRKIDPRAVQPTQHLCDDGPYIPAASTDIRKRFEAIRTQQQRANTPLLRKVSK